MAMPIVFEVLLFLGFQSLRLLWNGSQYLKWCMDGTHKILRKCETPEGFDVSAHIFDIQGRYWFDALSLSNSINDFILSHSSFTHPNTVLRDEVSLYCVTKTEAVFVEASPGVEMWRSKHGPFHKLSQKNNAVRVITMPLVAFYQLADMLGDPKANLVFLEFIPRSGSTMLTQVFEATGKCVAISEPHVLSSLFHPERSTKELIASVRLLCKPRSYPVEAFVLKMLPVKNPVAAILREHFSRAKFLFIYREARPTIHSYHRLGKIVPFARLTNLINFFLGKIFIRLQIAHQLNDNNLKTDEKLVESIANSKDVPNVMAFLSYILFIYMSVNHHEIGLNIPAIKYEDLLSNPEENVYIIFKHCGLSSDLVSLGLTATNVDSQKNSPISRDNLRQTSSYTDPQGEALDIMSAISDFVGLPHYTQKDARLSSTFTKP